MNINAPDIFNYWAPNSQWLATTPYERSPEVWDAVSGKAISQFTKDYKVSALSWSPDGKLIASYGDNGAIFLWEAATGHTIYRYQPRANFIASIAWSPDEKLIVSGGDKGSIEVWQAG